MPEENKIKDLEKRITEPEAIFARARDEAFDYVVTRLRENYSTSEETQKLEILQGLVAVTKEDHPIFNLFRVNKPVTQLRYQSRSPYDPATARTVREKAGFDRAKLARELGFTEPNEIQYARNFIYAYETGVRRPGTYPHGKVAPKYLQWLKEHGYDPFELSSMPAVDSEIPRLELDDSIEKRSYNRTQAKKVRKQQGLSQRGLVELLGYGKIYGKIIQLSIIENGHKKIDFPPKSAFEAHYMNWLKDHGYNPFGLK